MIGPVYIENISGVRYSVSYLISGDEGTALSKTRDICYEQTVEFPEDLTPEGDIKYHIVGRIEDFAKAGLALSGTSPGGELVEIVEITSHPWFLACQFHPEFKSRPSNPHPLFKNFIKATLK